MNTNNVKIITNTQFNDLYELSKYFYYELEYDKIAIDGNNGFYSFNFLNYVITNNLFKDIDIMVYIDEDCFITNKQELQNLINYVIDNEIDCAGMPDGGVISTRTHNPLSINQFFCILNLNNIRSKYNYEEILNTKYSNDLDKYLPISLIKKVYTLDDFEPYYKLFFWMLNNNFKFLYLDAEDCEIDNITTILKSHKNVEFAYHTWYARQWKNENQNNRINTIIEYCKKIKK